MIGVDALTILLPHLFSNYANPGVLSLTFGILSGPVCAWKHCRISPPRFLAECCKK